MKDWTLLALVQEFCKRQNLAAPASVTVAQDEETLQLWGLLNEEVAELNERGDWPQLHWQCEFQHEEGPGYLALQLYGAPAEFSEIPGLANTQIATLKYPTKATLWAKKGNLRVYGPLTDQQWTALMLSRPSPPPVDSHIEPASTYYWRMAGNGICIYPVPRSSVALPAGSLNFILDGMIKEPIVGFDGKYKEIFDDDRDICVLPGRCVLAGLRWRWRSEKGLPYAEHQRMYETLVLQELGNAGAGPVRLDEGCYDDYTRVSPGIVLPSNWGIPVPLIEDL